MIKDRDIVVIGAGSAGLTAGLFASRYGHSVVIVERLMGGGQIINVDLIENYPGFPAGTAGFQLGPSMQSQAVDAGAEIDLAEVTSLKNTGKYKILETSDKHYQAKAVIIAGGSYLRKLGIPGENEFEGRGVSHCASCDGSFFQNQTVGVVGGGDSALDEALALTEYASHVLLFLRRDAFRGQKVLENRVLSHEKIEVQWNTQVKEILGQNSVEGLKVLDLKTGETSQLKVEGVFIYVGLDPHTSYLSGFVDMDAAGHIATNLWMESSEPGIFAAGDIRQNSASQVITAAGDGATAAIAAHKYITSHQWPPI